MKFLIIAYLAVFMLRTLITIALLFMLQSKLNKRIDQLIDSFPDERSIKDLEIEVYKVEWYIDSGIIMHDIINPIKKLDTSRWVNPQLIHLLYEHYNLPED